MGYCEFLIMSCTTIFLVAASILFVDNTKLVTACFIVFLVGVFSMLCFRDAFIFLKELRRKIFLEKLFIKMAKEHCKDKYNKTIEPLKVRVNYYQDFIAKKYINSGTVFFDRDKKLFVKISLDTNFTSARITDNLVGDRNEELVERLRVAANTDSNDDLI